MKSIRQGFRKAGEGLSQVTDYLYEHPGKAALVSGGSILGTVGILQALDKPQQEAVVDAAIAAEQDGGGEVAGISGSTLLGAAVVLSMMDEDDDLAKRIVTTTPGKEGQYSETLGTAEYVDPMGQRRYDATERGIQRIKGPVPQHIVRCSVSAGWSADKKV
jgi:hypothetical protein